MLWVGRRRPPLQLGPALAPALKSASMSPSLSAAATSLAVAGAAYVRSAVLEWLGRCDHHSAARGTLGSNSERRSRQHVRHLKAPAGCVTLDHSTLIL